MSISHNDLLRIGTRKSDLAMTQTRMAIAALRAADPRIKVEIVEITTTGDRSAIRNAPMDKGKGDFVKEIEAALLANEIDAAVHSTKDMPVCQPKGLVLSAFLPRADPRDSLLSRDGWTIDTLPDGARIGTSSPRRKAMLLRARPDLAIESIRGNVPTRLRKMMEGQYDATILARAGLDRLGLKDAEQVDLATETMLPSPCQGIVAIETREDERADLWQVITHNPTRSAALCERAATRGLEADCHTPLGVYAHMEDEEIHVEARLLSPDGQAEESHALVGPISEAEALGVRLADLFAMRPAR